MKQQKGFAVMNTDEVKQIARKGGLTVSGNRDHMQQIGRLGGIKSGEARRNKKVIRKKKHA